MRVSPAPLRYLRLQPPSRGVFTTAGIALVVGVLGACGPEFTSCEARRSCPLGGQAGQAGDGAEDVEGGAGGARPNEGPGISGASGNASNDEPTSAAGYGGGAGEAGGDGAPGGGSGGDDSSIVTCSETARPPRLIAPLSTAWVTSRRPTVELERGDDCGPVAIDFCAERACTTIISSVELGAEETSARPSEDLPTGVVFWRARSGDHTSATWQFTGGQGTLIDTWWGTLPDFNGDGKADVAVGTLSGKVFVYYGSEAGLDADSPTLLEGTESSHVFGAELASVGDINGDGFADLLVGAPASPAGGVGSMLHVFRGGAGGLEAAPHESIEFEDYALDDESRANPPFQLSSVMRGGADVNGDGYSDFVATSPQVSKNGTFRLFFGSADDVLRGTKTEPTSYGGGFGRSIALCDLNGDRRTDMVVGAPEIATGQIPSTVQVYEGAAARMDIAQELSRADAAFFGGQVACADLAKDGYPDVAVGDTAFNLYTGDVALHANAAGAITETGQALGGQLDTVGACSGSVLGTVGDMNGDGVPELAVGGGGWLRVMFSAGDSSSTDYVEVMNDPNAIGFATVFPVLGADINGDGLSDLVVGSPDFEEHGRITIFRGNRTSRIVYPSAEHIDAPQGVTGFGVRLSAGF